MIWFIDIDGCLCDNRDAFTSRCSRWLDNNMIEHKPPDLSEYDFGEVFGVDPNLAIPCFESEEFAGYYIEEPADGAVEFLQSLDTNDELIIILTARHPDDRIPITDELHSFLGSHYDERKTIAIGLLTKLWLEWHKVPFHNIIFRKDKATFCAEYKYNAIAIEDDPSVLEGYTENGVPCICMRAGYNEGLDVMTADTWFDIAKMYKAGILKK